MKKDIKRIIRNIVIFIFIIVKIDIFRIKILEIIRTLDDKTYNDYRRLLKKYFNIQVGKWSYGQLGNADPGTIIGSFCSIAPGVKIGGQHHPINLVSTHPFLFLKNRGFIQNDELQLANKNNPIIIGDDVWIGINAIILPGVKIATGAIVGAGAVVTHDVPPYSIVAGVPAKIINYRFSNEVIKELIKIEWTSWDDRYIKSNLKYFYDMNKFINYFSKND